MTKAELIDKIASGTGLSKADASRSLDSTLNSIRSALKKGQKVTLVGFGTSQKGNPERGAIRELATLLQSLPQRYRSSPPGNHSKTQ